MSTGETSPVIYYRCRERRVVGISFGQAEAAPCAEDEGQVAGVAFEVFAIGVAIRVGGGLGGVAKGLVGGQYDGGGMCSCGFLYAYKVSR